MKYLLIGIGGVYNYGCEAIIRGSVNIIRCKDEHAEIFYASSNFEYDRIRLDDCSITVIPRKYRKKLLLIRCIRKLFTIFRVYGIPMLDDKSFFIDNDFDYILSIGGDIYTPGYFNGKAPYPLMNLGEFCESLGSHYIIWGASIGPFSGRYELDVKKHFDKITGITIREPRTVEYLHSLHLITKLQICSDPAFTVASELIKTSDSFNIKKPCLAVNLSPFTLNKGNENNLNFLKQLNLIISLVEKYSSKIILVPHVVPNISDNGDNDYQYLKKILEHLPVEYRERVTLLNPNLGFIKTKEILIKCDFCIAARMHCAINAITSLVPTVFIAYTSKAYGMCEYVYGNRDYVYSLDEIDRISVDLKNILNMHQFLKNRVPQIQIDSFCANRIFM